MDSTSSTSSVDYRRMYAFEDPIAKRYLRLETSLPGQLTGTEQVELAKGRLSLTEPLKLVGYMGTQVADLLWSGSLYPICVSSRIVEVLRVGNATGWSTYPVEVYDRGGHQLAGYHGLSITGPTCMRDKSRSEVVGKAPIVSRGAPYKVYRGLYFDESQWDGSDFFWISNSGGRVVTERVYRLLRRSKVRNVLLTPLADVEILLLLDRFEHDDSR